MRIDQLFHGYREGHRRLAASAQLDRADENVVLELSDISTGDVSRKTAPYVSGYPLPSGKWFAMAKTWYADELPRPGCVWTRTLLLPTSSLSSIDSDALWHALLSLSRPNLGSEALADYSEPLVVTEELSHSAEHEFRDSSLGQLLAALCLRSDGPVLARATDPTQFGRTVIELWAVLPHSIREGFAFSIGAAGIRSARVLQFDLQVIPTTTARSLPSREFYSLDLDESPSPESLSWSWIAAEASRGAGRGGLEERLRSHFGFLPTNRASLGILLESLHESRQADERRAARFVFEQTLHRWPAVDDGAPFKETLLASFAEASRPWATGLSATDRLSLLLEVDAGRGFLAEVGLFLPTLGNVARAPERDQARLLEEAAAKSGTWLTDLVIQSITDDWISERTLPRFARQLPESTTRAILAIAPEVSLIPEIWSVWHNVTDEAWSALLTQRPSIATIRSALESSIENLTDDQFKAALSVFPEEVVGSFLEIATQARGSVERRDWWHLIEEIDAVTRMRGFDLARAPALAVVERFAGMISAAELTSESLDLASLKPFVARSLTAEGPVDFPNLELVGFAIFIDRPAVGGAQDIVRLAKRVSARVLLKRTKPEYARTIRTLLRLPAGISAAEVRIQIGLWLGKAFREQSWPVKVLAELSGEPELLEAVLDGARLDSSERAVVRAVLTSRRLPWPLSDLF